MRHPLQPLRNFPLEFRSWFLFADENENGRNEEGSDPRCVNCSKGGWTISIIPIPLSSLSLSLYRNRALAHRAGNASREKSPEILIRSLSRDRVEDQSHGAHKGRRRRRRRSDDAPRGQGRRCNIERPPLEPRPFLSNLTSFYVYFQCQAWSLLYMCVYGCERKFVR